MSKVELKNVTKIYDKTNKAIDNLSLTINNGEFFILLGPTGAGKTTTLRSIAGLEKINSGKILFDEEDYTSIQPAFRDTAFVFQQFSLYPHYKVFDNLAFPLKSRLRNFSKEDIKEKVEKIAEMLKIKSKLNNKATELSGGEMQRVAIGRALVREPNIYLMDEPLSSLDAKLRETLRVELKNIQRNLGATILYVTHDQAEATTMADRIGVLEEGKLVQVGTPEEIYNNPISTYVAHRLGSPRINIVNEDILALEDKPSNTKKLGIRPENIKVNTGNYEGKIRTIESLGAETVISIDYKQIELLALFQGIFKGIKGENIKFDINTNNILYFNDKNESIR
jgi:multiple sugar transport system ATP-binding protein|tara:strand:- start:235 stop:1248 length:1014 start_codon:yes stop_codon:yes gene_type:complete